jgi:hypothetical protein
MRPVDIQDLFNVSRRLEPLGVKFAFTGGAIVGFLLDMCKVRREKGKSFKPSLKRGMEVS